MAYSKLRFCAVICITLLSFQSFGQSPWLNNNNPGFFAFEFSKVKLSGGNDGLGFLTAVYDLSGGFSVGEKTELIVDLPISHFKASESSFPSETTIGNLYVGIRTGDRSKPLRVEIGASLPTTAEDKLFASSFGTLALLNREEKFTPNTWGLNAKLTAEKPINDNGLYYRVRGGLLYWKLKDFDVSLLHLDLMGQIGLRTSDGIGVLAAINSRVGLTEDSKFGEDDAASFLFALGASYRSKNFEPGLTLNVPLDDPYQDAVSNVFNVSLLFHLED
ncbi:MAG: hypothetical protein ABJF11_09810 [Reichenbachiella sp.]|uniref:hypothetical protein n=1 Tax=Reichenbachiella sp. TaxID=2184521 RepID=UPI0032650660